MARDRIERLRYFQRQFLGAEDFADEQCYHRGMRRRHHLGPHTWGIVTGLELVEIPRQDGEGVDLFVLPGLAVDGYGREIVVLEPTALPPVLFESFNNLLHRAVWIAYAEERALPAAGGFAPCEGEDPSRRTRETFRFVIDPPPPTRDPVRVGGEVVEEPLPDEVLEPGTLVLPPDTSVPHQELPDDPAAEWLVRLGTVRWDGPNRLFLPAAEGRLLEERRHGGAVMAELLAPTGRLTVRDRATAEVSPLPPDEVPEELADDGVEMRVEGRLEVARRLVAQDDVELHGSALELYDRGGGDSEVPTALRREEAGAAGGVDLEVGIGEASDGENRLVVLSGEDELLSVADDGSTEIAGETGIGGDVTVRGAGNMLLDGGQLNLQREGSGSPEWGVRVDGENLLFLEPDDDDRIALEILDTSPGEGSPVLRLHGNADATLSAEQLIDLTDGGITELHTHPSATTSLRGMVEIAGSGESGVNGTSGARLVVAANDSRLLTIGQKNDLTDGGLTTLHRHPNGILHNVHQFRLKATAATPTDVALVDLGETKRVVAFIHLRAMDPLADFDQGDGFFADISRVDGARPPGVYSFGGAHLGADGSDANLLPAVFTGNARRLTFRLRTMQNAEVWADALVFFEDL